jgi:serine/threonine-protein kinase
VAVFNSGAGHVNVSEMSDETKATSPPTALAATQVRTMLPDPRRLSGNALGSAPEAQRYREHGLLGRGGMGEIMLVEDAVIGREIAVKTIAGKLAGSKSMRERFLREVRIQGQLEHPSIVPVYDVGVDASGNDYFTMKRIAGRTLATVLHALAANDAEARHEFPRNALLAVFRQICLAIAFAHSRGAIHRDLKPANVMVGDFGEVYVLDWGIARLATEPDASSDEQVLGTPGYMAPEQLEDPTHVDERSDVYALGAILFEILALEPWHRAPSVAAAITSTLAEPNARPALRAPQRDIPPELDDLCAHATAAPRDDRVPSARDLAAAIERYLEGDRDLERRREQARRHAAAARDARERVARSSATEADAARREALREAGRAVALDPDGREGLRAAVELMLEPPHEVPAEVHRELERAQSDRVRAGLVPGIIVFCLFMAVALVVPLVAGPVSWVAPVCIVCTLVVALALSANLLRKPNIAGEHGATLVIAASVAIAIGLASMYAGPMMIIPPLAVALANALAASQMRWRAYLTLCVLSVSVPVLVEWVGLVPRSYEFAADGLHVRPVVMQLSEVPVRITSLVTTLGALIGSVFYVRRVTVVEAELRRTWLLHNWHLRQMAQMTDNDVR